MFGAPSGLKVFTAVGLNESFNYVEFYYYLDIPL